MMAGDVNIVIGAEDRATAVINAVSQRLNKITQDNFNSLKQTAAGFIAFSTARQLFENVVTNVKEAADRIDALTDIANGLGESVGSLRRFQFAMNEAGNVSAEQSIQALQKMQKVVGEIASGGNDAGQTVFAKLGLDAQKLSLNGPIQQFTEVKKAIASIGNDSERAAVAQKLLGKSAADLIPAILGSQEAFEDSLEFAKRINYELSEAEAVGIANMNDALGRMDATFESIYSRLAAEIAPLITIMANDTQQWIESLTQAENTTIPNLVEQLVRRKGQIDFLMPDSFGEFFNRMNPLNMLDTFDELQRAGERALSQYYAMQQSAKDQVATRNEQVAVEEDLFSIGADALAQAEKLEAAEEKLRQSAEDRSFATIARLEKELLIAQKGMEAAKLKEDLEAAAMPRHEERIRKLHEEIQAQEKINDIKKQFDDEEKQRRQEEQRRQEKIMEEEARKQEELRRGPDSLQATESRILTRGPSSTAMDKIADSTKESAKRLASIDENLKRDREVQNTVRFQEVA